MKDVELARDRAVGRASQSWKVVLVLLWITSMVEGLGFSQVSAFLPIYLQSMGLPESSVPQWVGVLNSLIFVLGLPLVPFWGVWADKYSRKAIIIRSCLVEAVVFGTIALSREPWQLAIGMMCAGFQLGNTGVMLAALRDIVPLRRLGTAIAVFGASTPVGFAAGPALGGLMIDGLHTSVSVVYAVSALLSVLMALMLALGLREVRPEVRPSGRLLYLAFGAVRGVFADPLTRNLFALFGLAFLARQMANPFLPLLVQRLNGGSDGLAIAVALVVGTAALVGGLISPVAGAIGDRVGFRPVLIFSLAGAGLALIFMPLSPSVPGLAWINVVFSALAAAVGAMITGLLAMELPPERRSATLNLIYLPLYLAGIVGPTMGALAATAGLSTVFVLAGCMLGLGAVSAGIGRYASTASR
ncbi:MAG: MFS transporter [Chloroflexota bacterium]|nr:MAG: MFS transporter [Chloroflexota bacterium]